MILPADDEFLAIVAQQARMTYATQQLEIHQSALQRWQPHQVGVIGPYGTNRVQHGLVYYQRQAERWLAYLEHLVDPNSPC